MINIYKGYKVGRNKPEKITSMEQGIGLRIKMVSVNGCNEGRGRM